MRRVLMIAALASLAAACSTTPPPTPAPKASGPSSKPAAVASKPAAATSAPKPEARPAPAESKPTSPAVADIPVLDEKVYDIAPTSRGFSQTGKASWYGKQFHGRKTASGERYDMHSMTAAHRKLPMPRYVRVTNKANGKSVVVKVNDRGPFHGNRVLDVSYAAAAKLGMIKTGTATVDIEVVDPAEFQRQLTSNGSPVEPAKIKPEPGNPQFFVQVGAFGGLDSATALQSQLLATVYAPVVIDRAESPDPLHRVQVGPFATRRDAEKMSQVIEARDLGSPRIVSR